MKISNHFALRVLPALAVTAVLGVTVALMSAAASPNARPAEPAPGANTAPHQENSGNIWVTEQAEESATEQIQISYKEEGSNTTKTLETDVTVVGGDNADSIQEKAQKIADAINGAGGDVTASSNGSNTLIIQPGSEGGCLTNINITDTSKEGDTITQAAPDCDGTAGPIIGSGELVGLVAGVDGSGGSSTMLVGIGGAEVTVPLQDGDRLIDVRNRMISALEAAGYEALGVTTDTFIIRLPRNDSGLRMTTSDRTLSLAYGAGNL